MAGKRDADTKMKNLTCLTLLRRWRHLPTFRWRREGVLDAGGEADGGVGAERRVGDAAGDGRRHRRDALLPQALPLSLGTCNTRRRSLHFRCCHFRRALSMVQRRPPHPSAQNPFEPQFSVRTLAGRVTRAASLFR